MTKTERIKRSRLCFCGAYKLESDPFCFGCECYLSRPIKGALMKRPGDGFEEAYDVATRQITFWREWANCERQEEDRKFMEAKR